MQRLDSRSILIMATSGFEESELTGPRDLFGEAGATVVIASPTLEPIQATDHDVPTITVQPDLLIDDVDVAAYDALVLPGGVINPDALRTNDAAIALIRAFDAAAKPVGAICHGPWLMIEADILRGRTATSWPSIRTDMRNAGALVVDEAAVTDGHLVTSRQPSDVPAFCEAIAALL